MGSGLGVTSFHLVHIQTALEKGSRLQTGSRTPYIFCKVLLLHVSYSAIHGNKYWLLWSTQKVSEEDKTDIV